MLYLSTRSDSSPQPKTQADSQVLLLTRGANWPLDFLTIHGFGSWTAYRDSTRREYCLETNSGLSPWNPHLFAIQTALHWPVPTRHLYKDLLLVGVDVDTGGGYEAISEGQSFHIGISIFDTRSLTKQPQDLGDAVKSYQFINNNSKPCRWAAKSFLFGESKLIELADLPASFFSLTQGRDYVLVAHGIDADIKFFNNLNPEIVNGACYILDTVKAAQYPLQLYYRYSLESLLDEFNIRYAKLHAAGNDAHFALKALLMIAVRDGQMASAPETTTTPIHEDLFRILDAIAHAPVAIPIWTEIPPTASHTPQTKPKLGIFAKRRLRAAAKAASKASQELPYYTDELNGQGDHDGENQEKTTGGLPP